MIKRTRFLLGACAATLALGASLIGCAAPTPLGSSRIERPPSGKVTSSPPEEALRPGQRGTPPGVPMPRLNKAQLASFQRGQVLFDHQFTPQEGAGPLMNDTSCLHCHIDGGSGGSGAIFEGRVGVVDDVAQLVASTGFDELHELGGPVLQFRNLNIDPTGGGGPGISEPPPTQQAIDELAALKALEGIHIGTQLVNSLRGTTQVAGNGLLTSIADEDLFAREADHLKRRPFGITGHVNRLSGTLGDIDMNRRTGRLGWKAQLPDNLAFLADASVEELGLSSPHHALENVRGSEAVPEVPTSLNEEQVADIETFCALMTPPTPAYLDKKGLAAFQKAGCTVCHWSGYETADKRSKMPINLQPYFNVLGDQKVEAYSDLLVHNMGVGLADGFVQGTATGGEWRTAPLWGLRFREQNPAPIIGFYMHDRLSFTLENAIQRHQSPLSEANEVIDNYNGTSTRHPKNNLTGAERAALLNFLKGL